MVIDNHTIKLRCENCKTESIFEFYQKGSNYSMGNWYEKRKNVNDTHNIAITLDTDPPEATNAVCITCNNQLQKKIQ